MNPYWITYLAQVDGGEAIRPVDLLREGGDEVIDMERVRDGIYAVKFFTIHDPTEIRQYLIAEGVAIIEIADAKDGTVLWRTGRFSQHFPERSYCRHPINKRRKNNNSPKAAG